MASYVVVGSSEGRIWRGVSSSFCPLRGVDRVGKRANHRQAGGCLERLTASHGASLCSIETHVIPSFLQLSPENKGLSTDLDSERVPETDAPPRSGGGNVMGARCGPCG